MLTAYLPAHFVFCEVKGCDFPPDFSHSPQFAVCDPLTARRKQSTRAGYGLVLCKILFSVLSLQAHTRASTPPLTSSSSYPTPHARASERTVWRKVSDKKAWNGSHFAVLSCLMRQNTQQKDINTVCVRGSLPLKHGNRLEGRRMGNSLAPACQVGWLVGLHWSRGQGPDT